MDTTTQRRINLLRHALGIDDANSWPYRNYFCPSPGGTDEADWSAMIELGLAKVVPDRFDNYGGLLFRVTPAGIALALASGDAQK